VPVIPAKEGTIMAEQLSRAELRDLYDRNVKGLKIMGKEMTFEEWLAARERARTDLGFLREVLGEK
jgi:hypothetical protein